MSVRFVTSDNNYIRFNLIADEFTTDVTKWAIDDAGVYIENPEFIEVKIDNDNRIIWAIKADGTIYFGAGVPPQVEAYVLENKKDILATVATKVDKEEGKSLIDNGVADTLYTIENPEYTSVEIDKDGKILGGRKIDGTKFENTPLETPLTNISFIENKEWTDVKTDDEGHIISGFDKNGVYFFNKIEAKVLNIKEINISEEGAKNLQEQLGTFDFVQGQTNIESIARLGYNIQSQDTPPENSIAGFIEAYKHHYRSMLADVRWTSDGIPVALHDETINAVARNGNGTTISEPIKLSELTLEEVDGYDFGIIKGNKYAGLKIMRLDEFIRWSKLMNVKPYLEIKDFSAANPELTDDKWLSITSIIDKYGMQDRCAFILDFAYNQYVIPNAQKVHTKYPKSDICAMRTNAQLTLDEECALWAQLKGTDNDVFWYIFNENVMTGNISNALIEASNAYGISIGFTEIRTVAQVKEWLSDTNNLVCTRVAIRNKPINEFVL